MNITTKNARFVTGLLALLMVLSPLTGFAKEKENENKKDKKSEVKTEQSREDRSCLKAFGHLIAPGWNKKNSTSVDMSQCWFPFGISKKFHGTTTPGTTTPDTVAPVLSAISAKANEKSAVISWDTNEKTQGVVFYATTSAALDINSTATPRVTQQSFDKDHDLKITGLATSTTYFYKIMAKDASGNTAYSDVLSFTTKTPVVQQTYPVISQVASLMGSTTAQISWKTNEPATSKVYYGTSTLNLATAPFVTNGALETNHMVTVSGLSTSTSHMFVVESKNASGNTTQSNSFTLTTQN